MQRIFSVPKLGLLLLLMGLWACAGGGLQVSQRNFEEEVAQFQNLEFTFSEPIGPEDQLNVWVETPYMDFEPAVQGRFRWETPQKLVFSPDNGFAPSTAYTLTLNEELLAQAPEEVKKGGLGDENSFTFHTPYLELESADATWGVSENNKPLVELTLAFNYDVDPEEVLKNIELAAAGEGLDVSLLTNTAGRLIRLAVPHEDAKVLATKALEINVKGLAPRGSNHSVENLKFTTEIPDIDHFAILEVKGERVGTDTYIRVYTNQALGLSPAELQKLINLSPTADYEVEVSDFGFSLKGNFENSKSYELKISEKLEGVFQKSLGEKYITQVVFGKLRPMVEFSDERAAYLSSKGEQNIGLRMVGIDELEVQVHKIYQNNILHFLRETVGLYNYSEYSDYRDSYNNYGSLLYEETLKSHKIKRKGAELILNMKELLQHDEQPIQGIYVLVVRSSDDRWVNAKKILTVSDVGVITKSYQNGMRVFLNGIYTAEPLSQAKVSVISSNNQEMLTGTSDSEGVVDFPDLEAKLKGFSPAMLLVEHNNELSYMALGQNPVNYNRFDVSGYSFGEGEYQAFLYGERNLYRPGEDLPFKCVVRNKKWQPIDNLPVKFTLKLPNGKTYATMQGKLNKNGALEQTFKLPENAVTGSYELQVHTSSDVHLASKSVSVEEFMPQRIKISSSLAPKMAFAGQSVTLDAQALNFFGPPAANRNYEAELVLTKSTFSPDETVKELEDFNFRIQYDNYHRYDNVFREGKTDEAGKLQEVFEVPLAYKNQGLLQGEIFVTVHDETGRPVTVKERFPVYTQQQFVGIKPLDRYWLATNSPLQFPVALADRSGKPISGKVRYKIIRYEWQSVLEKNYYGDFRYVSRKVDVVEDEGNLQVSGAGTRLNFTPTKSGRHEVRLYLEGMDDGYVQSGFYAYGWGSATASSFKVDKVGDLKLVPDKEKYNVGETAKVLCKAPFSGKLLVTLERDQVYEHFYVDTDEQSAGFSFEIKPEHLPNIYVSATLIRPIDAKSTVPLTVAHGVLSLKTEKPEHKIEVNIRAPERSRSAKTQEIVVETNRPGSEVTVAVVDEGILQIKGYETPNPYDFFFQKRALEVRGYDLYPRVFQEISLKNQSYGADGYDLGNRTNPLANRRVKPLAFWSGTLVTDRNGLAKYNVPLPRFSGAARIMAVAISGDQFGSAAQEMKIADPLVMSTGLPRFLSPGDEVNVPVTLTNTTDKALNVSLSLSGEGAVELSGKESVEIAPQREAQVFFTLKAASKIGLGKVTVLAKAGADQYDDEIELTVRPSTSLLKESGYGEIQAGQSKNLQLPKNFMPGTSSAKLVVSKSPVAQFTDDLNYLVGYPHGCVEQTVSKAFPQLYLADIARSVGQDLEEDPNVNIREALAKLNGMQLYNGGLSYWQGGTYESWWGTIYAADFMLEAKKAGFEVNETVLENMLSYLSNKAKRRSKEEFYYYNAEGKRVVRQIPSKSIFYSLFVLAKAGQKDISTMNFYAGNPSLLARDSRYLLAQTYQLLGDRSTARKLLPQNFEGERAVRSFGGSFYSALRDRALALNALIDADPQNNQIPILAKHLSEALRTQRYLNTQERAVSLLALGKLAKKANASQLTAKISAGGKALGNFDKNTLTLRQRDLLNGEVKIETSGTGSLYYFWEVEGLSATGEYKEEDSFLKVRRTFFDRNGSEISPDAIQQNDLVVVRLTVQALEKGQRVENVVITDMLPAGLEVENPRLSGGSSLKWVKNSGSAEHIDFRDDRVNIFTTARDTPRSFYYMVRAVSKGRFKLGPVSADAMYNGEYHSYHGGGELVVE